MNRHGSIRLSRRCGAWMLLALAFGLASAPAASRAGCVHPSSLLRAGGSNGSAFFELLPKLGAMVLAADDLTVPPPSPKSPCPGGTCSQAPIAPLTPPTAVSLGGGDLAALVEVPAVVLTPRGPPFRAEGPLDAPAGALQSIFHPPRPFPAPILPALGTA